jgi:cell division protein FtsB
MRGRGKVLGGALLVAAAFTVLSVTDPRGFRRYFRLRQEVAQLVERNQRLEEENRAFLRELSALREDPAALERAAREELGFVKPGEVVLNLE